MYLKSTNHILVIEARFWPKVEKTSNCWLWTGYRDPKGYGRLHIGGQSRYAHRISYELNVGPIPDGMFICHHCDNPRCVNPVHLFCGTPQDNVTDRERKGRGRGTPRPLRATPPRPRIPASVVIAIRRKYATSQVSYSQLTAEYGLNQSHIGRIITRKAWPELDG